MSAEEIQCLVSLFFRKNEAVLNFDRVLPQSRDTYRQKLGGESYRFAKILVLQLPVFMRRAIFVSLDKSEGLET